MKKEKISITTLLLLIILASSLIMTINCGDAGPDEKEKIDDWKFDATMTSDTKALKTQPMTLGIDAAKSAAPAASNIGFAVGGAKDINNFRENIKENYLPLVSDITYEGLFYDYYFDTGEKGECEKLFCPSYSYAVANDPISDEKEYYLSVGLNSGIKEKDFQRKNLNLVIVLDISGSMSSSFRSYHYDQFGTRKDASEIEEEANKSKMQLANESVVALINHLKPNDRFGMVLFESTPHLAKPLHLIDDTDIEKIKGHILEVKPQGGTYMAGGMEMATELFEEFRNVDHTQYENRIIFLTDAMPNIGEISEEGLLGMTQKNAEDKIYTTFIGIGVDFNTELIEHITKIRGANYYSVHSADEFKKRMDDEFEFMVTPLVFNLKLELDAKGYEIAKVYGSPEADEATGEITQVNTLFPSKTEAGETKGGLVLLKLKKTAPEGELLLRASCEKRNGEQVADEAQIQLSDKESEFFENTGIRKGILLSRYAELIKNWIIDERRAYAKEGPIRVSINEKTGIIPPEPIGPELGKWERQSIHLRVSGEYQTLLKQFTQYFKTEIKPTGDETLKKELELLEKLANFEEADKTED